MCLHPHVCPTPHWWLLTTSQREHCPAQAETLDPFLDFSCGALVTLHSRLVHWATRSTPLGVCTLMYAPLHIHAILYKLTEGTLPGLRLWRRITPWTIPAEISCGALVTLHSRLVHWATRSTPQCVCTLIYAPLHIHATLDNLTEGSLPGLRLWHSIPLWTIPAKIRSDGLGCKKTCQSFFNQHILAAHLFLSVYIMTRWNALLYPQQGVSSVYIAPSPALPLCGRQVVRWAAWWVFLSLQQRVYQKSNNHES